MFSIDDPKTFGPTRLGFADAKDVDLFVEKLAQFERGEFLMRPAPLAPERLSDVPVWSAVQNVLSFQQSPASACSVAPKSDVRWSVDVHTAPIEI